MKASITRRIVLFAGSMLLVFFFSMLVVTYNMNNRAARDNAENLLSVFESQITDSSFTTKAEFDMIVHVSDAQKIRVTIIGTQDGLIIADSLGDSISIENHLERPEIRKALEGGIGSDTRKSETTGVKYLYCAKKVTVENLAIILRVCVPVNSINSYIYGIMVTMVIVFLVMIIVALVLSKPLAKTILAPYGLIKDRLDRVIRPSLEPRAIQLTRYDDLNTILIEVDSISDRLNTALVNYQEEKDKLSLILENINQGIIAIDHQGKIISCNKTAREYFGFEYSPFMQISKAIRNKALLDNIDRAISANEYICYDHTRINGEIYEVRFYPLKMSQISLIISAQNVTDVRKVSVEKQEFFENAGHELKTPLSSILGYSEMLFSEGKYNELFVEKINKEAFRMKELIDDMLKISELEQKQEITSEILDLYELVSQVVLSYKPKVESKKITLISTLEPCQLLASKEKITEVVANLIDNAIKYTDIGGRIEVILRSENDKIVFSVEDNGIGIPTQYLTRIFERFFRVDKGRSKTEGGTGLGLSIVKHICNYYNAPITVVSREPSGTKFTITFNQTETAAPNATCSCGIER